MAYRTFCTEKNNNKIVINIGQEYKNVDKNFKTCLKTTLKLDEKYDYVSTNLPGDVFSDHKRIKSYLLPIFSNPFPRVSYEAFSVIIGIETEVLIVST